MANKERLTQKKVIDALMTHHGIKSAAARACGCSSQTIANYIKKYPAVAAALEESKDSILDLAEEGLFQKVKEKDLTAIKFVLSNLGKGRGYTPRQEVTGADNEDIKITFTQVPARDLSGVANVTSSS